MEGVFSASHAHRGNVVLSCARWMTFAPEWVSGSQYLTTSNAFHLWVYLVVSAFFI